MLHLLAAFAEHEREQISTRTKEALKAAKKRGVVLGKHGTKVLSKQNKQSADEFAESMQPIIQQLKKEGFSTFRQLRDELNNRLISTYREGGQWHLDTVYNVVKRFE